jgi:hypothetical protein
MVGRLEPAVGAVLGDRLVVEAAVGERSAQGLWKNRNSSATSTPLVVRR